MPDMPSVIDPALFRELLAEQVLRGEITDAEAVRCWRIHGLPVERWLATKETAGA